MRGPGNPKLFFFNTPENRLLIKAMESLERELATDEDKKGIRDKIADGNGMPTAHCVTCFKDL